MKKILIMLGMIGSTILAIGQEVGYKNDSLRLYDMQEVVVTATRMPQELIDIPQRINLIPTFRLMANPSLSADDVLNQLSGVNLIRSSGILSKKTLVSVRGMGNEQGRTLVLIDGVPINKSSTGSANLNRISPDMLERIEVVKGPGSSLYGGNAMGGVVNMITKKPTLPMEGSASFIWGEMGTFATNARIAGTKNRFFYSADGFYQKSNGYNNTPKDERTSEDISTFMHEYALTGSVGMNISTSQSVEGSVRYYDGTRGNGIRYFFSEPQQGQLDLYNRYKEQDYRLTYRGSAGKTYWTVSGFYGQEKYLDVKAKGSDLYDVDAVRRDWYIWGHLFNEDIRNNVISGGMEVKGGFVDGRDVYRTSSDVVIDKGNSLGIGIWAQDELSLLDNRLKIVPSLRLDIARVYDGGFFIENATKVTDIYMPYTGKLKNNTWTALSPKLCIQYNFNGNNRIYVNSGWGFRPGNLEDMVRTGPIKGGVIMANTKLKPEHICTTEIGGDASLWDVITLSPSLFYSRGRDFIYNVNTGETILMGNKERPIFAKSNIAKVEIYGGEIDLNAAVCNAFNLFANYSYMHTKILKGSASIAGVETNLKGNHLTYVPDYKVSAGFTWLNSIVNINASYVQYSKQFIDDTNDNRLPAFATVDAKLWHCFGNRVTISVNGRNLFNRQVNDNGMVSIGRLVFCEAVIKF